MRNLPQSRAIPGRRENDEPRHACLYADYPGKHNPADAELDANAILIAAAPDLLDALDTCMGTLEICFPEAPVDSVIGKNIVAARAAIAKATGGAA